MSGSPAIPQSIPDEAGLELLLQYLKEERGFDFTGYKRSTLSRRITRRMQEVDAPSFPDYLDHLQVHPTEFSALFNTILINVTSFFRDDAAWEVVERDVLPTIAARSERPEPIRMWCAGCSSGEEAFSLAILAAQVLGDETFRDRVKIYATDIDEAALSHARLGAYDGRAVQGLERPVLERFFEAVDGRFVFRPELRRSIIFGRHDLVQDAPISRLDVLLCRNTLMYFNADTQDRVLRSFAFALRDGGYLFLGKSETLISRMTAFRPVDLKRRVFVKPGAAGGDSDGRRGLRAATAPLPGYPLAESAFEHAPVAQLVVGRDGELALMNGQARTLFGLHAEDQGRPFRDLEVSYRPVELRSRIEQVYTDLRSIVVREAQWSRDGDSRLVDVHLNPLLTAPGQAAAVSIAFTDVTRFRSLQDQLRVARRELETAYDELQSTIEELETTNEELQSTNEELETTNEELQSTNEELETMNEELQSTNEELETINDDLRERSGQLDQANAFLESILRSLGSAVVVVARDLRVQIWNGEATALWGLREDEVTGQDFLGLDIGLPVEALRSALRSVLAGANATEAVELQARDRRGRDVLCRVSVIPFGGQDGKVDGAILLMDATLT